MGYHKAQDNNEINPWAFRRLRRFGRIHRQRLSLWLISLAVIFLILVAYFGVKIHFHGSLPSLRELREDEEEPVVIKANNKTVKKHRQRYFPCEVGFVDSVSKVDEPEDNIKFSRFTSSFVKRENVSSFTKTTFGGHQTLHAREDSYYARNQTIHCGFVKRPDGYSSTGFDLQENDKRYMSTCRVVVSSCIFGSSDFLRRPTSKLVSDFSKKNVCFVMFVDEQSLAKLSTEGKAPDENGNIGLWRIIVVKNLPYEDLRKVGKIPKFLSHRLFPSSRYSIWLDSKLRLNADPMLIIEYFLWRHGSEYAISTHYARRCVWEEVLQNKRLNKYSHSAIDEQFNFYQNDGLTKYELSGSDVPLPSFVPEGSFIVRAHTPMSNLFSCLWFNEVDRFTSRDQLSFAYTYLKLRRLNPENPLYLNMFKVSHQSHIFKILRTASGGRSRSYFITEMRHSTKHLQIKHSVSA